MPDAVIDRGDSLEPVVVDQTLTNSDEVSEEDKIAAELVAKEDEEGKAAADAEAAAKAAEEAATKARDAAGKFEAKIPKSRFDEAVNKERTARETAEARVAALEAKLEEKQGNEQQRMATAQIEQAEAHIVELEKQHAQLLLDGDADKAAATMREIRMTERAIARAETQAEAANITSQALESDRMELTIAELERDYPIMNPKSEMFDESLVNFALAEQRRLMQNEGLSPSVALRKATVSVAERFGKPVEPPASEREGLAKAQAEDRKRQQVDKNLAASKAQPASTKDVGLDSDKMGEKTLPDITKMTPEEFKALPESTKAKMRGDTL